MSGRKSACDQWITDESLLLLEGWARDGLIDEQIAANMGISIRTFYTWKKRFPQILQAIKKGKAVVDYAVENALLKKALSGDVGACCFWLKNRRPDKWRDKPNMAEEEDEPLKKYLEGMKNAQVKENEAGNQEASVSESFV